MEFYYYICPAALLLLSAGAVIMDIFGWRISNYWIYGWGAAGFVYEFIFFGGEGIWDRMIAMALPILLLAWLFYFRMMGAGDIKLFAATGVWLGSSDILICLLLSFVAGAFTAIVLFLKNRNAKERFGVLGKYAARLLRTKVRIDYGIKNAGNARVHVSIFLLVGVLLKIIGVY